jgi:hypothetical protein
MFLFWISDGCLGRAGENPATKADVVKDGIAEFNGTYFCAIVDIIKVMELWLARPSVDNTQEGG